MRENYDEFYPGYGDSWPLFQGAIGMTYEQASRARARVEADAMAITLTYRDGVVHHFTAAIDDRRDGGTKPGAPASAISSSTGAARSRKARRARSAST